MENNEIEIFSNAIDNIKIQLNVIENAIDKEKVRQYEAEKEQTQVDGLEGQETTQSKVEAEILNNQEDNESR